MKRLALLSAILVTILPVIGCLNNRRTIKLPARNFTGKPVVFDLRVFLTNSILIYEHPKKIPIKLKL